MLNILKEGSDICVLLTHGLFDDQLVDDETDECEVPHPFYYIMYIYFTSCCPRLGPREI